MGPAIATDQDVGHHDHVLLDHVGLNVPDLAAASAWYSATLDLQEEFAFAMEDLEFAGLVLVHPTGWRLELISRAGARPGIQADHPNRAALTLGFSHFAVRVDDVAETYARLVAAGATHRLGPQSGPERGMPMAFVADPWGNLIEILTRAASSRPTSEVSASAEPASSNGR